MANPSSVAVSLFRAAWLVLFIVTAGCVEKNGEAVVLSKEYLPPAPKEGPLPDARQTPDEQWRVQVEMRADLRKVDVLVESAEWQKLKVGDRVNVQYSQGKYTGTVWHSEIK